MPAIVTFGGIALAALGIIVIIAGLPDRSAGLGLGSDLVQSGATLFAAGLIVSALGLVLRALRDVAERVEEAGFGLAPRPAVNDELSDETPMPLPRAGARNAVAAAGETEDEFAAPAPQTPPARAPRTPQPAPRAPRPAAAQPASRQAQPAPRVPLRAQPRSEQLDTTPEEEIADHRDAPVREPRWMRAQAEQGNRPQAAGVVPLQANRPTRGPAAAPANPQRREPAAANDTQPYGGELRRRPMQSQPQPESDPMQAEEPAAPSVVRSGIIGGMAYTLYSDGSIEAELPIGTVRFNSLQELQEHVKRAGEQVDDEGDYREPNSAQR